MPNGVHSSANTFPAPVERTAMPPGQSLIAARQKLADILETADIRLGGQRQWDLQVYDDRFYSRVLRGGSVALGESYMDEWWDADALDQFFVKVHRADLECRVRTRADRWLALLARLLNCQTEARSRRVAAGHYDVGNDVYEAMLGKRMQYTCAYWPGAADLDEAQENKLHLIARKLHIQSGDSVLDLGAGFGGLAYFLAREHGCRVVAYNISKQQVDLARSVCRGLPVRVECRDYREASHEPEKFDRIVAIGLCEHVGFKNYRSFLELARNLLKDRGLFLLHTIGSNISNHCTDAWYEKYIFPGGMMPSIAQLGRAMERLWVVEDWHNFGPDYDRTLLAWWRNFEDAWPVLRSRYSERFFRMWKYYLMSSAGAFRARKLQLWQIVLSKGDIPPYTSVR